MSKWIQAKAYIKHFASALTKYDVHSPFLFDFITNVLQDTRYFNAFAEIEAVRKHLLQNAKSINVEDMGAGSKTMHSAERRISDIARTSLSSPKYGQLLFRIANHYAPVNILELGTSLGISALYLARGSASATVTTLEGSAAIAHLAQQVLDQTHTKNIEVITGNFSTSLPALLQTGYAPDLVYIDGNHRLSPTVEYFNACMQAANANCIFILDDIHWSAEMEKAWEIICADEKCRLSVDLFYKGIIFTDTALISKQHVSIRF